MVASLGVKSSENGEESPFSVVSSFAQQGIKATFEEVFGRVAVSKAV